MSPSSALPFRSPFASMTHDERVLHAAAALVVRAPHEGADAVVQEPRTSLV